MSLQLTLTDYQDPTRWRWVLADERGAFLADYEVRTRFVNSQNEL